MFGVGTLDRPWLDGTGDEMAAARHRDGRGVRVLHQARHARTTASTTATSRPRAPASPTSASNLDALADDAAGYQERTGVRLLWGTANLFTHPRYQAGAATNPDPEVFAYAAAQVKHMLEVTQRLGGENYVLWGGREGYDTLLNTDLRREGAQLARFLHLVAEHKHRDRVHRPAADRAEADGADQAPVRLRRRRRSTASWSRNGLEGEYRVNIEANHATLAGHSFHHEVAFAVANGMLGSIDANRGDPQNGWDTDQFPNSVEDLVAAAVRDPARRRAGAGRLQLRRQAAPPEHRPERPVPRPHRRARHARAGPARGRRPGRAGRTRRAPGRSATPAGTAHLGTAILGGSIDLADARGARGGRRDRPASVSRAARSGSRTSSTRESGPRTADR